MKKIIRLKNLDCANCAAKMENGIKKIKGVEQATVSFMNQKIILEYDERMEANIISEVKAVCQKIEPDCELLI